MREIKFRLILDDAIAGYEVYTPFPGRWHYAKADGVFNNHQFPIAHQTKDQYTGLKDKNGKEIYEGDILKQVYECAEDADDGKEHSSMMVVMWNENRLAFGAIEYCFDGKAIPSSTLVFDITPNGCVGIDDVDAEYCEIIGNIHDNPELLEAK